MALTQEQQARFNELVAAGAPQDIARQAVSLIPTGVITGEDLTPQPDITHVTPEPTPIPEVPKFEFTAEEKRQQSLIEQKGELETSLVEEPTFRAQKEREFGLIELERTRTDLTLRARALEAEIAAIPLRIAEEFKGRGGTRGGVESIEIGRKRTLAIEGLTVNALIQANKGNLTFAQSQVDRVVRAKFDPIIAQIKALKTNAELIASSPNASLDRKSRALQVK